MNKIITQIKSKWMYFLIILSSLGIDLISKAIIRQNYSSGDITVIIPPLLKFIYVRNYGIAFGIFNDITTQAGIIPTIAKILILVITISAALFIIRLIIVSDKKHRFTLLGLAFITGGALGNFIDRLIMGYVTDFINIGLINVRFQYNFNIADLAITIGISLIILAIFIFKEDSNTLSKKSDKNDLYSDFKEEYRDKIVEITDEEAKKEDLYHRDVEDFERNTVVNENKKEDENKSE